MVIDGGRLFGRLSLRRARASQLHGRALIPRARNEHVFVIASLALRGVVIQLDGRGAQRLAMTPSGSTLFLCKPPRLLRFSR